MSWRRVALHVERLTNVVVMLVGWMLHRPNCKLKYDSNTGEELRPCTCGLGYIKQRAKGLGVSAFSLPLTEESKPANPPPELAPAGEVNQDLVGELLEWLAHKPDCKKDFVVRVPGEVSPTCTCGLTDMQEKARRKS